MTSFVQSNMYEIHLSWLGFVPMQQSSIPLHKYEYTTNCLSILTLMSILIINSILLLWIKLLWHPCKSSSTHMFSVLLGKYLRLELLGHIIGINFIGTCQSVPQNIHTIFCFYQQWMRVLFVSHSWQHLVLSVFFILAILVNLCSGIVFYCD